MAEQYSKEDKMTKKDWLVFAGTLAGIIVPAAVTLTVAIVKHNDLQDIRKDEREGITYGGIENNVVKDNVRF